MNETLKTIADVPELAADFLQLVIENTLAGRIEAKDAQIALSGFNELAGVVGSFALGYSRGQNGFYVPIVPEQTRFEFNSRPEPNIILVRGDSLGYVKIGPWLNVRNPRVVYEQPLAA